MTARRARNMSDAIEFMSEFSSDLLMTMSAAAIDLKDEGWGDTVPEFVGLEGSISWSAFSSEHRAFANAIALRLLANYEIEDVSA